MSKHRSRETEETTRDLFYKRGKKNDERPMGGFECKESTTPGTKIKQEGLQHTHYHPDPNEQIAIRTLVINMLGQLLQSSAPQTEEGIKNISRGFLKPDMHQLPSFKVQHTKRSGSERHHYDIRIVQGGAFYGREHRQAIMEGCLDYIKALIPGEHLRLEGFYPDESVMKLSIDADGKRVIDELERMLGHHFVEEKPGPRDTSLAGSVIRRGPSSASRG